MFVRGIVDTVAGRMEPDRSKSIGCTAEFTFATGAGGSCIKGKNGRTGNQHGVTCCCEAGGQDLKELQDPQIPDPADLR
ncbi:hypothetical protein B0G83_13024 [Paraburkholderia sp. BL21I4N1]|nr:hypothetical protein B0G83_13024 [Paraburkholderia sp. BL21I4N1]